jgi:DNA uptake protein ComE-like DNA-binding protein
MKVARPSKQRSLWPWISLLPIGLGAWAPIYAGLRVRAKSWILLGILWSAFVVAGFVKNSLSRAGHSGNDELAGLLMIVGWVGAVATSFTVRGSYERQLSSPLQQAELAGQQRLQDRQRAIELAQRNPALAREIGIGRPDEPGAADVGLVDVNNASVTALLKLPGINGDAATEIIEARQQCDGFSSLEDLGATLDLDGATVEGLRGEVVFLPRRQSA